MAWEVINPSWQIMTGSPTASPMRMPAKNYRTLPGWFPQKAGSIRNPGPPLASLWSLLMLMGRKSARLETARVIGSRSEAATYIISVM